MFARPIEQLTILFNIMFFNGPGGLPKEIFDSRVTFIKTRTPSSLLDYRPIAVGNFITRIFHRILARRIKDSITNHLDQVGFKKKDGVGYNILKLHNIINESWNKSKELILIVLDIKKASDSKSHEVLYQVMLKRGLSLKLAEYITASIEATNLIGNTPIKRSGRGVNRCASVGPMSCFIDIVVLFVI